MPDKNQPEIYIFFISNRYYECNHGNTVATCFCPVDCGFDLIFDPSNSRGDCKDQRAIPACWPDVSKNQLWLDEAKAAIVANMQRINLYLWGIMEEKMSIFCTPLSIWFLLTCEKH